jgi:hypothetical protein
MLCVMVDLVADELDRVHERIAGRFTPAEPRARVRKYLTGLVAGPERLDPGRDTSGHVAFGHVAFGHGFHYCLGAPLARMEAEVAALVALATAPPGHRPQLPLPAPPGPRRHMITK